MNRERVVCSDCLEHMQTMPENSVDSIVTDPPYGLAFMGAKWDSFNGGSGNQTISERQSEGKRYADENKGAPRYANSHGKKVTQGEMAAFQSAMTPIFAEALRVAKPGAHLLCFGGTRTFHRMACAIEDAGWEIRDCIMWVYGSGFPKSMDVGKAIDKALGAEREKVPNPLAGKQTSYHTDVYSGQGDRDFKQLIPATDEAAQWDGWGTCLKPAWEPIIVARKPLDGTVAQNVLKWGVGALNIDACRVPTDDTWTRDCTNEDSTTKNSYNTYAGNLKRSSALGRFPANLVHDGSQMVLDLFPDTQRADGHRIRRNANHDNVYGGYTGKQPNGTMHSDLGGSAARFFYCAKASKKDRGEGNVHPTVKPTELMKWLVQLVTPEGGVVLDPFAGSGTTLVACERLGFDSIGIEREPEYVEIIKRRLGVE